MKCTILRNIGKAAVQELNLVSAYGEGAVVDLPQHEFDALVKHSLCEPVAAHAVATLEKKTQNAVKETK